MKQLHQRFVILLISSLLGACTSQSDTSVSAPPAPALSRPILAIPEKPRPVPSANLSPLERQLQALDCEQWAQLGRMLAVARDDGKPVTAAIQIAKTSDALQSLQAYRMSVGQGLETVDVAETLVDYIYYQIPAANAVESAAALHTACLEWRYTARQGTLRPQERSDAWVIQDSNQLLRSEKENAEMSLRLKHLDESVRALQRNRN